VPLGKPEERYSEIAVDWRSVAVHPPVVGRKVKTGDIEARSKSPLIDLIFPHVNVLGVA
jgi:hypothetical protein